MKVKIHSDNFMPINSTNNRLPILYIMIMKDLSVKYLLLCLHSINILIKYQIMGCQVFYCNNTYSLNINLRASLYGKESMPARARSILGQAQPRPSHFKMYSCFCPLLPFSQGAAMLQGHNIPTNMHAKQDNLFFHPRGLLQPADLLCKPMMTVQVTLLGIEPYMNYISNEYCC